MSEAASQPASQPASQWWKQLMPHARDRQRLREAEEAVTCRGVGVLVLSDRVGTDCINN